MKTNPLLEKSFVFGVRMFGLNALLVEKKLFAAADQVFRSGTSIGANVEEALGGSSRKDFVAKLKIAYREARETSYWLRLLDSSHTLEPRLAASLLADAEELKRILAAILTTVRDGKHNPSAPSNAEEPTPTYTTSLPTHFNEDFFNQFLIPNS